METAAKQAKQVNLPPDIQQAPQKAADSLPSVQFATKLTPSKLTQAQSIHGHGQSQSTLTPAGHAPKEDGLLKLEKYKCSQSLLQVLLINIHPVTF